MEEMKGEGGVRNGDYKCGEEVEGEMRKEYKKNLGMEETKLRES